MKKNCASSWLFTKVLPLIFAFSGFPTYSYYCYCF